MNIAIITIDFGVNAMTLDDSINCYSLHGKFKYNIITLKNGFLNESLENYDALIIHYACVSFPYSHYLPVNAITALQISEFKGIKLAFAQDEYISCKERFKFFEMLKINHLFSVAPPELHELLYPSILRNFSVSTVLCGYISDLHLKFSLKRINLKARPIDLVYRGRELPEWMGKSAAIKKDLPKLIKNMRGIENYNINLDSKEKSRFYGDKWFEFLKMGKVAIGTPSGSNFLDIDGKFNELKQPHSLEFGNNLDPIPAEYNVISPRYFDYVASGNLIALTNGNYSNIPLSGTYLKISDDFNEIIDVLKFSHTLEAQSMVNHAQEIILGDKTLHFSYLVKIVENYLENFSQTSNFKEMYSMPKLSNRLSQRKTLDVDQIYASIESNNQKGYFKKFVKIILPKKVSKIIISTRIYKRYHFLHSYKISEIVILVKSLPSYSLSDFLSISVVLNLLTLKDLLIRFDFDFIIKNITSDNKGNIELDFYGVSQQKFIGIKNFEPFFKRMCYNEQLIKKYMTKIKFDILKQDCS